MRIHCDDWTLDTATRLIERGGGAVHVSPKAFDLLTALLLERPRVLSKAELLERLWPDTFVSESNLASLVAELRAALGDQARRPRYLRTVHRHGYAFSGTAIADQPLAPAAPPATACARLLIGAREIALTPGANVLGRVAEAAAWIESSCVSRRHAVVTVSADGASIEDLGSKNGTFVNRRRVDGVQPLADRDEIGLGPERLVFRLPGPPSPTETQAGRVVTGSGGQPHRPRRRPGLSVPARSASPRSRG
jgi:DNA-binding winged helix-turn-helix (wHTH) protein